MEIFKRGSHKKIRAVLIMFLIFVLSLTLTQCKSIPSKTSKAEKEEFVILSGSENKALEPIIQTFAKEQGINIVIKYMGSIDIMQKLAGGSSDFDAVWPANSIWINLGDKNKLIKYQKSIMTSPVVFGIRKSVARQLGFINKQVQIKDISNAIRTNKLKFIMTSATQSNSGASAYIGFLYALLGNPEIISVKDLHKPGLESRIKALLAGVDRSSGSSEWLKELYLNGNYDAMVNYESLVIETNRELIAAKKEPLYVIYSYDGLTVADSPLGYADKGDRSKEEIFRSLQAYLLSEAVQGKILALGRRTGYGGILVNSDKNVFNPDWGINPQKVLSPIKLPSADVIREALNIYQTTFRKPSFTIFCLDVSSSMDGDRFNRLKDSMELLLNQERAKNYFLQATSNDVIVVISFADTVTDVWKAVGGNQTNLKPLIDNINRIIPFGGTDIYTPTIEALKIAKEVDKTKYHAAVILMTDGKSSQGKTFADLQRYWVTNKPNVPVYSIMFGEASEEQLNNISRLTGGRTFDGRTDLFDAFKEARGYN